MTIALAPYRELAARAEARPPLPPPMTRKSVSFEMGAMARDVCEKWRDIVLIRLAADMGGSKGRLAKSERGCMDTAMLQDSSRYRGVEGSIIYTPAAGDKSEACREDRSRGSAAQTQNVASVQIPNPTTTSDASALEKLGESRWSVSSSSSHLKDFNVQQAT
jgi:hypothetical protein